MTLGANGTNGSVHHAMSTIMNPIDIRQTEETKELKSPLAMKYNMSPSRIEKDNEKNDTEVLYNYDVKIHETTNRKTY